jgi:hypothetical protein
MGHGSHSSLICANLGAEPISGEPRSTFRGRFEADLAMEACMPTVINGLPAHVLLIHVVVVLVPLGALFTALSAVWPAARHKLGFLSPLTCLIAFLFVPITIHAGRWLQQREHFTGALGQAIQKHANLGASFWVYALLLLIVSVAVWLIGRRYEFSLRPIPTAANGQPGNGGNDPGLGAGGMATATRTQPRTETRVLPIWASAVVAVVGVAVAGLVTWQLYRVGDAGAHAVWGNTLH